MEIIAICNQKGGVAKTTTAVNLAASLGVLGHKVLLLDLDPQGNASIACGIDKKQLPYSILEVLVEQLPADKAHIQTDFQGVDLIASNQDATAAEVILAKQSDGAFVLKNALEALPGDSYDFVIIDCPPALNILTVNALSAARHLIVPVQCEYYALEGLTALLDSVSDIRASVNAQLKVLGFLRTMFDKRGRLATEVSEQLESYLQKKVFETVIPRNIRLAEAPSHGMPAYYYERSSKGAQAYMRLANEVLERLQ